MITAILTFHNEGAIAIPSIRSADLCRAYCETDGIRVELLAVLDRADQETTEIVEELSSDFRMRVLRTDIGDCGGARNEGVRNASEKYCAFLDGDDLWGHKWLRHAWITAEADGDDAIYHPEVCLYFGVQEHIFSHVDPSDSDFDPRAFAVHNYWTALTFSSSSLLRTHPIEVAFHREGFAYEDWHWHQKTLSAGIAHKNVPGTVHFIRQRKSGSILNAARNQPLITKPVPDFQRILFQNRLPIS